MCKYWKKAYLCGCHSHIFRDRCPSALRDPNDYCANHDIEDIPRRSFFKCFDCMVQEVREEKAEEEKKAAEAELAKKKEEERIRKDKLRRDAEDRARLEREEDVRRERDRRAEAERARREGGAWVELGGKERKKRGRAGGVGAGGNVNGGGGTSGNRPGLITIASRNGVDSGAGFGPNNNGFEAPSPLSGMTKRMGKLGIGQAKASPQLKTSLDSGPNGAGTAKGGSKENVPKNGIDPGGRAGTWGPKVSPITILKKPY
ncbi:hypothetical protein B0J11DRAFT_584148 [Dendryphion nanum]|uniref:Uncharacterized protein n=1 Tax=Dendryphion nanum TaxID=256645 RepID=A0A9P9ICU1_9PLEO|nr:hypothetical protein B0J11DRAFT_584148 [Dendryphion nanum]